MRQKPVNSKEVQDIAKMSDLRPNQRKAIEALATGHTIAQAAVVAGVTERTVYNWRAELSFKAELQRLTDNLIAESATFLSTCLLDAFKTMHSLCQNAESESTRLAAAKAITDSTLKIREQHEIIDRIADLEQQIRTIGTQHEVQP